MGGSDDYHRKSQDQNLEKQGQAEEPPKGRDPDDEGCHGEKGWADPDQA